jgi:electron transport complex protein RnfD
MSETFISSPHTHAANSVTRVMLSVVLALVPGYAIMFWFFGWGILVNTGLAVAAALTSEALMLKLRRRPIGLYLTDGSAMVTALLLALSLPPLLPWWIPVLGTAFAIIVAKHLYGGLGYNLFNPAMVGYALLLIAFPQLLTQWLPPTGLSPDQLSFQEILHYAFSSELGAGKTIDMVTMATPLDTVREHLSMHTPFAQIESESTQLGGRIAGVGWEWINLAFLLGGLWLVWRRIISWQIPLAMLGGLGAMAAIFYLSDSSGFASPLFHLFSGAAMLGAFFIATDPVTASTTPRGQLIYGACIGIIAYVIRTWGGYPDGVAFGVLLMNAAVPLIDYFTQPRVFGHGKGPQS